MTRPMESSFGGCGYGVICLFTRQGHGFNSWIGRPTSPFVSREFGSGSMFMSRKIFWASTRKEKGSSNGIKESDTMTP